MTNDGTQAFSYYKQKRCVVRGTYEALRHDAATQLWPVEDGAAKRRFPYDPGSESSANTGNFEICAAIRPSSGKTE